MIVRFFHPLLNRSQLFDSTQVSKEITIKMFDWNKILALYADEKMKLDCLVESHKGHESGGISPKQYEIRFISYSIAFIPVFKCQCGYEESLAGAERYDNM